MKARYTNNHSIACSYLVVALLLVSSFDGFSSTPKRYQISGINNHSEANGIYVEAGTHGYMGWPYFKHETNDYFLYFKDEFLPVLPPFPLLHLGGFWTIGDNFYTSIASLETISYPSAFEEPASYENIVVENLTVVLTAATEDATNVTTTSATLHGTVRAAYTTGTVSFEYGITNSYGNEVSATPSQSTDNEEFAVSAELADLLPSTTYYYRVKIESDDEIIYGENLSFQTEDVADNVEINSIQQLVVYPNPTTNGFYVYADEEVDVLTMYDISGYVVCQQQIYGKSYVAVRALNKGIYFVQVNGQTISLIKSE